MPTSFTSCQIMTTFDTWTFISYQGIPDFLLSFDIEFDSSWNWGIQIIKVGERVGEKEKDHANKVARWHPWFVLFQNLKEPCVSIFKYLN